MTTVGHAGHDVTRLQNAHNSHDFNMDQQDDILSSSILPAARTMAAEGAGLTLAPAAAGMIFLEGHVISVKKQKNSFTTSCTLGH